MGRSPKYFIDFDQIKRLSIGYTIIRPTSTRIYYILDPQQRGVDSFDRLWQVTDPDTIKNLLTKDHTQRRPWLKRLGRGVADPSLVKGSPCSFTVTIHTVTVSRQ
jgi:hypothetical protein